MSVGDSCVSAYGFYDSVPPRIGTRACRLRPPWNQEQQEEQEQEEQQEEQEQEEQEEQEEQMHS